jgi:membrane-associated phospholipid phosphatase
VTTADTWSLGRPRTQAIALLAACLVLLGAGAVADTGRVPGWEQAVFHAINGLPDALRIPMWLFQLLGLLFVPAIAAVGAFAFRRIWLGITLLALIPLKLAVEHLVIKRLVERSRPATSICHLDLTCGHFRDVPLHGDSFVSGHAVIAWSVAWLVLPYLPGRWRAVAIGLAVLNSVARVYLGAHNPLDVVGGAAAGIAVAALVHLAIQPFRRDAQRRSAAAVGATA